MRAAAWPRASCGRDRWSGKSSGRDGRCAPPRASSCRRAGRRRSGGRCGPRNCGPATRQVRRAASPCNCHRPLRVAISKLTRRAGAFASLRHDVLLHRWSRSDCRSYAFAHAATSAARVVGMRRRFPVQFAICRRSAPGHARTCAMPVATHHRGRNNTMTIKVGDRLPAGTLSEYIEVATEGCPVGPNPVPGRRADQGQESRAVRLARRIHADLLGASTCRVTSRITASSRPKASTRSSACRSTTRS